MPFRKVMEDVFYFRIQELSHSADLVCERIDNKAFTGDILAQVKQKIETTAVVIADLTGANPNVYLEIGYAWGEVRPTRRLRPPPPPPLLLPPQTLQTLEQMNIK
jgi:hypothetical protein